jgi:hypothetical protein
MILRTMTPDSHGSLLLSVPVRREAAGLWPAIPYGILVVVSSHTLWRRHQSGRSLALLDFLPVVLWLVAIAVYAWPRNVRFYENGIRSPRRISPKTRPSKARFISWNQIQRYQWVGDSLCLVEAQSVLNAGGIPVAGEPWAIRPRNRPEVESLLARYAPRSA